MFIYHFLYIRYSADLRISHGILQRQISAVLNVYPSSAYKSVSFKREQVKLYLKMVQMVNFMLHVFQFFYTQWASHHMIRNYNIKINPKDKKIILKVSVQFLKENFVIVLAVEIF